MGFGGGVASGRDRPLRPQGRRHSSHGVLLDWLGAARAVPGARRRLLRRPLRRPRRAASGHHVTGVDLVRSTTASPSGSTPSSRPTSTSRLPAGLDGRVRRRRRRRRPRARDRARSSCSTTSAPARPGGEVLVSVPNFGHWYPRGRDRRRPVRLRPARPARPRPRPVLHPPQLRAARSPSRGLRIVERGPSAPRSTSVDRRAARRRRARQQLVRGVARADRAAARAWPTLFGYQFLYRLERGLTDPDRRRRVSARP